VKVSARRTKLDIKASSTANEARVRELQPKYDPGVLMRVANGSVPRPAWFLDNLFTRSVYEEGALISRGNVPKAGDT